MPIDSEREIDRRNGVREVIFVIMNPLQRLFYPIKVAQTVIRKYSQSNQVNLGCDPTVIWGIARDNSSHMSAMVSSGAIVVWIGIPFCKIPASHDSVPASESRAQCVMIPSNT